MTICGDSDDKNELTWAERSGIFSQATTLDIKSRLRRRALKIVAKEFTKGCSKGDYALAQNFVIYTLRRMYFPTTRLMRQSRLI